MSEPYAYYAADEAMLRNWWRLVGWCLQYRIKVFGPGGEWRSSGEMSDDIFVHRMHYGLDHDGQFVANVWDYQAGVRTLNKVDWLRDHQVTYFGDPPPKPWTKQRRA